MSAVSTDGSARVGSTPPLNPAQIELLKLFERPLTAQQLQDINQLISQYLAEHTNKLGTHIWQEKQLTAKDMDALLTQHIRTPYKK
ncbi:hypothetical protein [Spirosoma rhododendri]|uniref:Uncharacterized protein n=1 Tax=Spirosoma rhododendri TaxID=2728024 RepID=A0A7L5DG09_9BACT|nr:hypothetical protein [Spirosoma rhododendri]QJD77144.1 hypothetical protein HH216_00955 [Spirosoma rhododendri]